MPSIVYPRSSVQNISSFVSRSDSQCCLAISDSKFRFRLNLKSNAELREAMAVSHKPNDFREVVKVLEEKFLPFHLGHKLYLDEQTSYSTEFRADEVSFNLNLPPWLCQPVNYLNEKFYSGATNSIFSHLVHSIGAERT